MVIFEVWHDKACPRCGADLTENDSVDVTFICAESSVNTRRTASRVLVTDRSGSVDGPLKDIDRLIEGGHHAGSVCYSCGERLDDDVREVIYEKKEEKSDDKV